MNHQSLGGCSFNSGCLVTGALFDVLLRVMLTSTCRTVLFILTSIVICANSCLLVIKLCYLDNVFFSLIYCNE